MCYFITIKEFDLYIVGLSLPLQPENDNDLKYCILCRAKTNTLL